MDGTSYSSKFLKSPPRFSIRILPSHEGVREQQDLVKNTIVVRRTIAEANDDEYGGAMLASKDTNSV